MGRQAKQATAPERPLFQSAVCDGRRIILAKAQTTNLLLRRLRGQLQVIERPDADHERQMVDQLNMSDRATTKWCPGLDRDRI